MLLLEIGHWLKCFWCLHAEIHLIIFMHFIVLHLMLFWRVCCNSSGRIQNYLAKFLWQKSTISWTTEIDLDNIWRFCIQTSFVENWILYIYLICIIICQIFLISSKILDNLSTLFLSHLTGTLHQFVIQAFYIPPHMMYIHVTGNVIIISLIIQFSWLCLLKKYLSNFIKEVTFGVK